MFPKVAWFVEFSKTACLTSPLHLSYMHSLSLSPPPPVVICCLFVSAWFKHMSKCQQQIMASLYRSLAPSDVSLIDVCFLPASFLHLETPRKHSERNPNREVFANQMFTGVPPLPAITCPPFPQPGDANC